MLLGAGDGYWRIGSMNVTCWEAQFKRLGTWAVPTWDGGLGTKKGKTWNVQIGQGQSNEDLIHRQAYCSPSQGSGSPRDLKAALSKLEQPGGPEDRSIEEHRGTRQTSNKMRWNSGSGPVPRCGHIWSHRMFVGIFLCWNFVTFCDTVSAGNSTYYLNFSILFQVSRCKLVMIQSCML